MNWMAGATKVRAKMMRGEYLTHDDRLTLAAELILSVADEVTDTKLESDLRALSTDVWSHTDDGKAEIAADAEEDDGPYYYRA